MLPTVIDDRYSLIELLGKGGMAKVYLAYDRVSDRNVAIKVLREQYAEDERFVERFRHEARSAARLFHPNIVSVHGSGHSGDGVYYIAMEHVPRGTLKERIERNGALAEDAAVGVALQVAEALKVAHQGGVVHRDIKPQNLLVTRAGDVKVADFGIARASSSSVTTTGAVLGTATHISPEQAMGELAGPRSDLYSLGVVLYEMLTGELPYYAETSTGIAVKHVNEPVRSPKAANPSVSEALDGLTVRLLAKDPADRYPSAGALADDLKRAQAGLLPVAACPAAVVVRETVPPVGIPVGSPARGARTVSAHGARRRRVRRRSRGLVALLLGASLIGGLVFASVREDPGVLQWGGPVEAADSSGGTYGAEASSDGAQSSAQATTEAPAKAQKGKGKGKGKKK